MKLNNNGPFGAPRLADFPTSTPHASHRGAQLQSSLNDHGGGRVPVNLIAELRRIHGLRDRMHQFIRGDRALHRLPGIGCCIGLALFGSGYSSRTWNAASCRGPRLGPLAMCGTRGSALPPYWRVHHPGKLGVRGLVLDCGEAHSRGLRPGSYRVPELGGWWGR